MALQVTDITPNDELAAVGEVVLVVVDAQGGGPDDPLPPSTPAQSPMPGREERDAQVVELVDAFRAKGVPVVFVQEVRKPSLIDIGRGRDGGAERHRIEGDDAELIPGLDPRPEEYVIRKRRHSAFFGTELDIVLRGYGAGTIVLIGGTTDVSIHYTAVDAHQLDYRFRTVSELVIGSGQELHDAALRAMKYLQRDALVSRGAVRRWLDTVPREPVHAAEGTR